jgi:hypothetical protein
MFTRTVENTSPKRQRVNQSQTVHSLTLRACKAAKHAAVQLAVQSIIRGAYRIVSNFEQIHQRALIVADSDQ